MRSTEIVKLNKWHRQHYRQYFCCLFRLMCFGNPQTSSWLEELGNSFGDSGTRVSASLGSLSIMNDFGSTVTESSAPPAAVELGLPQSDQTVPLGLPQSDQTVLIVLYTATTALSVVGNILAIVVFAAGGQSGTELRWFLVNLAAADLIMAVFCMPFTFTMTMLGHWVFSAPMCPVVLFLQTVSVTASVFTSVAVGIDRYWVTNFPLKSRITKSRSPVVIAAIWAAACTLSSIQLIVGRSNTTELPGGEQVSSLAYSANRSHKGTKTKQAPETNTKHNTASTTTANGVAQWLGRRSLLADFP